MNAIGDRRAVRVLVTQFTAADGSPSSSRITSPLRLIVALHAVHCGTAHVITFLIVITHNDPAAHTASLTASNEYDCGLAMSYGVINVLGRLWTRLRDWTSRVTTVIHVCCAAASSVRRISPSGREVSDPSRRPESDRLLLLLAGPLALTQTPWADAIVQRQR